MTPERQLQANAKYYAANREKVAAMRANYYLQNKDALKKRGAKWRSENSDKIAEYEAARADKRSVADAIRYGKNRDISLRRNSEWHAQNKEIVRARKAAHRAAKLQACPSWADRDAMREIYLQAKRLTQSTGIEHHVDHIIPLKNKFVCGLHVPANLRAIPALENLKKKNRLLPDAAQCQ